jgi:hypothetical protein
VAAPAVPLEHREQRRVLARVVAVRRRRIDAVVGGEDEEVARAQELQPARDACVDRLKRAGESDGIVTMAVDLVGLHEVREDEARVELLEEPRRRRNALRVRRRRVLAVDADAREQVADLPDGVDRHAVGLELLQVGAARRIE